MTGEATEVDMSGLNDLETTHDEGARTGSVSQDPQPIFYTDPETGEVTEVDLSWLDELEAEYAEKAPTVRDPQDTRPIWDFGRGTPQIDTEEIPVMVVVQGPPTVINYEGKRKDLPGLFEGYEATAILLGSGSQARYTGFVARASDRRDLAAGRQPQFSSPAAMTSDPHDLPPTTSLPTATHPEVAPVHNTMAFDGSNELSSDALPSRALDYHPLNEFSIHRRSDRRANNGTIQGWYKDPDPYGSDC